ncbi:MAG: hypothetical protein LBQ30_03615 [Treponema sp.]|jgi:hypothetical protein|nr:hypothetical protein [Treponema sp.]
MSQVNFFTYFKLVWKDVHPSGVPDLFPETVQEALNHSIFPKVSKGFYTAGLSTQGYRLGDTLFRENARLDPYQSPLPPLLESRKPLRSYPQGIRSFQMGCSPGPRKLCAAIRSKGVAV